MTGSNPTISLDTIQEINTKPLQILIVDDEVLFHLQLKSWFADLPVVMCSVFTKEGYFKLEPTEWDVVICDLQLADGTGIEIVQDMRQKGIRSEVVMVSGYRTFEPYVQALNLAVADFLTKPLTNSQTFRERVLALSARFRDTCKPVSRLDNYSLSCQVCPSRLQSELYANVLDGMSDRMIVLASSDGLILECNRMTLYHLRYTQNELIGQPLTRLLGQEFDLPATLARISAGQKVDFEVSIRNAHQAQVPVQLRITQFKPISAAATTQYIFIMQNLTEQVAAERTRVLLHKQLAVVRKKSKDLETVLEKAQAVFVVGQSMLMLDLIKRLAAALKFDVPLMIRGETGTGKELLAYAAHYLSDRAEKPFMVVDCASIPGDLLESELFGYEKGTFTGADQAKTGKIELANGGTVFLDEIGEMPLGLQAKLLRVLQEKTIVRLGGSTYQKLDVRFVIATRRNLEKMVADNTFREDLLYRINVFPLTLPPLRDRREDIPELVDFFTTRLCKEHAVEPKTWSPKAMEQLQQYNWPGNIRELKNVITRNIVLNAEALELPDYLVIEPSHPPVQPSLTTQYAELGMTEDALVKTYAQLVLAKLNGDLLKTQQTLGISRNTLKKRLEPS